MATQTLTRSARTQARDAIEHLSLDLYRIEQVAHVVAFATEARKVLEGITDALEYSPEFSAMLSERIKTRNSWSGMEDSTGNVGEWIAQEISRINTEMTDFALSLTEPLRGKEATQEVSHG